MKVRGFIIGVISVHIYINDAHLEIGKFSPPHGATPGRKFLGPASPSVWAAKNHAIEHASPLEPHVQGTGLRTHWATRITPSPGPLPCQIIQSLARIPITQLGEISMA